MWTSGTPLVGSDPAESRFAARSGFAACRAGQTLGWSERGATRPGRRRPDERKAGLLHLLDSGAEGLAVAAEERRLGQRREQAAARRRGGSSPGRPAAARRRRGRRRARTPPTSARPVPDHDVAAARDDERPRVERVRRDERQRHRVEPPHEHGAAVREVVRRRAGRRRADQPVARLAAEILAADRPLELDHPAEARARDDDVVDRDRGVRADLASSVGSSTTR